MPPVSRPKPGRRGVSGELVSEDRNYPEVPYMLRLGGAEFHHSCVYGPSWLALETRSNWECVDRTLLQATVSPARTQTWSFGMKDPLAPMYLGVGMTGHDVPLSRIRVPR